jgi:ABC-2 type transport system permease protein
MTGFAVLVRKELLEQWRTLRLSIVAGLFLVIGIGSPLLARYTPEIVEALAGDLGFPIPTPTVADSVAQLLSNLGQFGALAAILLAMGAVAGEKDRGTAALLLTKPVARSAFLAAKVIAIGLTLAVSTILAAAAAWIYTAILFEQLPLGGLAALAGLTWLALLAYAAVTFLASTLLRSAAAAGGIGFGALIALAIISALPNVGRYVPPGLTGPASELALGGSPDVAGPVLAVVALIAVAFGLAWLSFRHQEL